MTRFFRNLPLSAKLSLIGFIPLLLYGYTSLQIYREKTQKIDLVRGYKESIQLSRNISLLVEYLQNERRYSYEYAAQRNALPEIILHRANTDSIIALLQQTGLPDFTNYTFLNDLGKVRVRIDSMRISPDEIMNFYTTAIYRINTLDEVPQGSNIYLKSVYQDLISQKLLSEMITSFGIIRTNIYNVLYTRKYMVETLIGMVGVYNIYKTYDTELLIKANRQFVHEYEAAKKSTSVKRATEYLDTLFTKFAFSDTYEAQSWWALSDSALEKLRTLRTETWRKVNNGIETILKKERDARGRTLVFLTMAFLLVIVIIGYIIHSITSVLSSMKLAAKRISIGDSINRLDINSNDAIGHLAESISAINENNKSLTEAANEIGNGNFTVPVNARSKDDMLGNAIIRMKNNLLYSNEQLQQMAEKYKTIFYNSPLPNWIYDFDTLQFLDVNEAAIKLYGYNRDEFLNMNIKMIRPDQDLGKLEENINEIKSGANEDKRIWKHLKKNGEIIIVEVMAHFIEYGNRTARMVTVNDITEKIRAQEGLKHSHAELRELASHLQNIREEERTSMAREVHDVLGQQITAIKMDASWLVKHIPGNEPVVKEKMHGMISMLDQTAITIRKIATELRPSVLDDFGLSEALEWHSREFEKRSNIKMEFLSDKFDRNIPQNISTGIFRIYQESLTNVARHAEATAVKTRLEIKEEMLSLTVADNGKGFEISRIKQKKTLGLLGMKERTLMIGGVYELSSVPGKGTTVTVTFPLAK